MQKQKKTRAGIICAVILQIILLIAMLAITAPAVYGLKPEPDFPLILAVLLIAFIVSVNLHELGHLIFGKLLGFRLISYQILMFNWTNQNGSMKFSLRNVKGISGYCAMAPGRGMPVNRQAAYFAGGIALNILTGLLSAALLALFPAMPGFWALFFIVFAGVSLYSALVSLIPFYSANNASDGMLFWNIILKRPLANKLVEYNEIITQLYGGMRPGDIDMTDTDDEGFMLMAVLKLYRYFKALDSGDTTKAVAAADWLENNMQSIPSAILPPVYYELCYIACVQNDAAKAKKYFEKAGKILSKDMDANGLRVKAYYAYHIERNINKTLELCDKALSAADRFPIRGQGVMERSLVLKLKEATQGAASVADLIGPGPH